MDYVFGVGSRDRLRDALHVVRRVPGVCAEAIWTALFVHAIVYYLLIGGQ